jgi:hypothetical protein
LELKRRAEEKAARRFILFVGAEFGIAQLNDAGTGAKGEESRFWKL